MCVQVLINFGVFFCVPLLLSLSLIPKCILDMEISSVKLDLIEINDSTLSLSLCCSSPSINSWEMGKQVCTREREKDTHTLNEERHHFHEFESLSLSLKHTRLCVFDARNELKRNKKTENKRKKREREHIFYCVRSRINTHAIVKRHIHTELNRHNFKLSHGSTTSHICVWY